MYIINNLVANRMLCAVYFHIFWKYKEKKFEKEHKNKI